MKMFIVVLLAVICAVSLLRKMYLIAFFFYAKRHRLIIDDGRFYTREFQRNFLRNIIIFAIPHGMILGTILYHVL